MLGMLTALNLDLARQRIKTSNRIRGFSTQLPSPLERVLGTWLEHAANLGKLPTRHTPAHLKHAGKARTDAKLKRHGARRHTTWAGTIIDALADHMDAMVENPPLYPVQSSMPGIAVRTAAIIIVESSGKHLSVTSASLIRTTGADHTPVRHLNQIRTCQPFRATNA